ncbi:MAG: hypothetical protein IJ662_07150 [Clostridia bacterium]|nr:hypothetical protein [Clostridia bacterium]
MTLNLGRLPLRFHPLLPLAWLLTWLLGGPSILPMLLALGLHECGHICMAKACRIPIERIEITPFGGVISMQGIDGASPRSAFLIAAGGPLFSGLGCLIAPVLRGILPFSLVQAFARFCLLMLVINLLPALPLDGGRMLRAVLSHFLSESAATRWLIRAGYAFGACLCGLSLLFATRGQFTLSPAFAGLYLIYAAAMEGKSAPSAYVTALIARRQKIERGDILPVELLAAGGGMPLRRLLGRLSGRAYHIVYVLSPDGVSCMGMLTEDQLCENALQSPERALAECVKK